MTSKHFDGIFPVRVGNKCRKLGCDCVLYDGTLRNSAPPYHLGCDCYLTIDMHMSMATHTTLSDKQHDYRA